MGKIIDFEQERLKRRKEAFELTSEEFLLIAEQVKNCGEIIEILENQETDRFYYDSIVGTIDKVFDKPHPDEKHIVHYEITKEELERMKDFICSYL